MQHGLAGTCCGYGAILHLTNGGNLIVGTTRYKSLRERSLVAWGCPLSAGSALYRPGNAVAMACSPTEGETETMLFHLGRRSTMIAVARNIYTAADGKGVDWTAAYPRGWSARIDMPRTPVVPDYNSQSRRHHGRIVQY